MVSSRPPVYPKRAVAEGIMGYSIVAYDLDGSGQARNARVIAARPAGVFDEAAVQALLASAFQPGVIATECRYVADFAFRKR
jgi:protein TonB